MKLQPPLLYKVLFLALVHIFLLCSAQDNDAGLTATAPPPALEDCNGIFVSYTFISRTKEFPRVKNVSAQSWAFKSEVSVVNAGSEELQAWKVFVGFQHREILVSADGAVVMDGGDFPVDVANGTYLSGNPITDLKTSIDTAGDFSQIQATIAITGTMFGLRPKAIPMPKTIKLENDGFKCPAPHLQGKLCSGSLSYNILPNIFINCFIIVAFTGTRSMYVCCRPDPKYKAKKSKRTKFLPRRNGDLSFTYDIMQAYGGSYLAQVTMENKHPLGRLDHWNLTWEWSRGEFIFNMRGAYTRTKDYSQCIYGPAGNYYKDLDFSQVMSCDKKPIIADLPAERAEDEKVGKLPFCCRNGSLLPPSMDINKAKSIFQLEVYKLPPDVGNRTTIYPPQKWQIDGILNPEYKCGTPIRVDPSEFPDPSGLQSVSYAIASWQVVCNITRPKPKQSRCCVSFSSYYNDSVVPCNTCACGCSEDPHSIAGTCDADRPPMLLPAEALLVPFANRSEKARAWAKLRHFPMPKKLPCSDNCGVSLNWHINSDYRSGWTARITLFNWRPDPFEDWFAAVQMKKAYPGYENVYSFNGTKLNIKGANNTIFFQGLKGLNFLMGQSNGSNPKIDPPVPGKQQSVISFLKKNTPGINIRRGDGFPTKVYFNGEECEIPESFPIENSGYNAATNGLLSTFLVCVFTFMLMIDHGFR
ncbi:hypothetical protein F8388_020691 [Cannabis sativa]|uniref:COBRA C-terminal domain-containing protein n=1 Tax=Cannabis sativa TaxID=3483 RepID=A0A7J6G4Y3_CANSA|nr:hypothetical protein F8388_020691 [Cannabis sativa]